MGVFVSPWISGTRAEAYFGQVVAAALVRRDFVLNWTAAYRWCLIDSSWRLCHRASLLGANAVVGLEVQCDPFGESLSIQCTATAALLKDIFGGEKWTKNRDNLASYLRLTEAVPDIRLTECLVRATSWTSQQSKQPESDGSGESATLTQQ